MGWGSFTSRCGGQKVRYVPRNPGKPHFWAGYHGNFAIIGDFRCVPLCVVETCAEHPVFAQDVGELWAAGPNKCPRGHESNASLGWGGPIDEAASRRTSGTQDQKPGQPAQTELSQGVFP